MSEAEIGFDFLLFNFKFTPINRDFYEEEHCRSNCCNGDFCHHLPVVGSNFRGYAFLPRICSTGCYFLFRMVLGKVPR